MDTPNNHYKNCVIEPIEIIEKTLTAEQYKGYLLGSILKYRLRAGHKTEGDIEKAMQYEKWVKQLDENTARKKAFKASDLNTPPDKPSWVNLVEEFNEAFKIYTPSETSRQFSLVEEEYNELCSAYTHTTEDLDAVADLIYVLIGYALKAGYDLDGAFREVHRSNMTKLGADGKPININGKIRKGPNYSPPDLTPYI